MAQEGSTPTSASTLSPAEWADFQASSEHFKWLRPRLEEDHWGEFAAISANGNHAEGKTRKAALANFEATHGKQRVTTFYIGLR